MSEITTMGRCRFGRLPGRRVLLVAAFFIGTVVFPEQGIAERYLVSIPSVAAYNDSYGKPRYMRQSIWKYVVISSPPPQVEKLFAVGDKRALPRNEGTFRYLGGFVCRFCGLRRSSFRDYQKTNLNEGDDDKRASKIGEPSRVTGNRVFGAIISDEAMAFMLGAISAALIVWVLLWLL